ncbi:type II secretion system major pseudopilin GspG [Spirochaetota bacterium]
MKALITKRIKNLFKSLKSNEGITLIEIMITIVIISIFAGVVYNLGIFDFPKKARVQKARTDINTFETVLRQYEMEKGKFPSSDEGLQKLIDEGYIKKKKNVLNDPWGNPYNYRFPGESNPSEPEIWSFGKDGKDGGTGFDADIKSWE